MPRGARVDPIATKAAAFKDRRSFVALGGKLYLKGKDLSAMRERVFERDGWRCVDSPHSMSFRDRCTGALQLSHRIRKSSGSTPENSLGSDDFENLCVRCEYHHRLHDGHGQPMHF
jgi:hypothetical protein